MSQQLNKMYDYDSYYTNRASAEVYFKQFNKRPSLNDPTYGGLAQWLYSRTKDFNNLYGIMNDKNVYEDFRSLATEKYPKLFKVNNQTWTTMYYALIKHLDEGKGRPSDKDDDPIIKKMGNWVTKQIKAFEEGSGALKDPETRQLWMYLTIIPKYAEHISAKFKWFKQLKTLDTYIADNDGARPSSTSNDIGNKKLGQWMLDNDRNYLKRGGMLKNDDAHDAWTKYYKYKSPN